MKLKTHIGIEVTAEQRVKAQRIAERYHPYDNKSGGNVSELFRWYLDNDNRLEAK